MKIAGVGLAAHIITQIIILVGFGIFFSLVHKYKTTRFAIPSPQELVGFRKLYNKTDFYALTSRGKKGGIDFSSPLPALMCTLCNALTTLVLF